MLSEDNESFQAFKVSGWPHEPGSFPSAISIHSLPCREGVPLRLDDVRSHPLRSFLERVLLATINTDDPDVSGIDLRHEYEVAAPAAGLTAEQTHQAQRNALATAFLSADEKEALIAKKAQSRPVQGRPFFLSNGQLAARYRGNHIQLVNGL